jgi:hypothetical protein
MFERTQFQVFSMLFDEILTSQNVKNSKVLTF